MGLLLDQILGGGSITGGQQPDPSASPSSYVQPVAPDPSQPQQGAAPIVVQGDNWHPHTPGWLGSALDTLLMLKGKQPVFQQRKARTDIAQVMPDFASDPLQTIHRLSEIPGEANTAYKMYDTYTTDQERDQSRATRIALQKDTITQRLGALAGAATPDNFGKIHQLMVDYVKRWPDEDPANYDIPDTYDKPALDAMSGGTISSKDQNAQLLQSQGLALRGQAVSNLNDYRTSRLQQLNDQLNQRGQALKDREDNFNRLHPIPKIVKTPHGDMELSPSGVTGRIGDQIWQKGTNGQWNRIH